MDKGIANRVLAIVFILTLVAVFYSVCDACTFVGIVRDPNVPFDPNSQGDYALFMNFMAARAYMDNTNAGWSVVGYGHNPSVITFQPDRHADPEVPWDRDHPDRPSTAYSTAYDDARRADFISTTLVIAHARQTNNDHPELFDPHPFVYANCQDPYNEDVWYHGMFGKPYALVHNGKVRVADQGTQEGLANKTGTGFSALDIFHCRQWTVWNHHTPGNWAIDSEHYAMLVMKYLMVQKNYYWNHWDEVHGVSEPASNTPDLDVASAEEWAIRRVLKDIMVDPWNTGMNGILTDGSAMWAIAKSNGGFPRTVGYRGQPGSGFGKVISAYYDRNNQHPSGYTHLWETGVGQVVYVTYFNTPDAHDMNAPAGTFADPQELRINPISDAEGNQFEPAISCSQADGSFVVVWVSNQHTIMGRWYNQMGLAEDDGFVVVSGGSIRPESPAIAHSYDGHTITVVWLEAPYSMLDNVVRADRVKRLSFTWDGQSHTWTPGNIALVATNECPEFPYVDKLAHPSIAYAGNTYVIAWEKKLCPPSTHSEIHVVAMNGDNVLMPDHVVTANADDHEPDVTYVFNDDNLEDYWAIGYHGLVGGQTYAKAISLGWNTQTGQWGFAGAPVILSLDGQHVSVAAMGGDQLYIAYNNGNVHVDRCSDFVGNIIVQESAIGEAVDTDSRPDIALRDYWHFYVCYDKLNGSNGRDVYCVQGAGTQFELPGDPVNQFLANDQDEPAMAIARSYPINGNFYSTHTTNSQLPFEKRRLIVWQTQGEDTGGPGLGIAGQFRGIATDGTLSEWSASDHLNIPMALELAGTIDQSLIISNPYVHISTDVVVAEGVTLTFGPNVNVDVSPGSVIQVLGTLITSSGCHFAVNTPTGHWTGIEISGSANMTQSSISGAETGVSLAKNGIVHLSGCEVFNCGTGVSAVTDNGDLSITGCNMHDNESVGISIIAAKSAGITLCNIHNNGEAGVRLVDAFSKISQNQIHENTGFGLECYGSSPVVYCNNFQNDGAGEVGVFKGSFPILWNVNGEAGGANNFLNDNVTLITMESSDVFVFKGNNNFSVGEKAYFMADMSPKPVLHDITGNFWNPNLTLSLLYPSSPDVWTWYETHTTPDPCASPKGGLGKPQVVLLDAGFAAEMSGNVSAARASYQQIMTQYPDSAEACIAAARLFETQRQIDSGYVDLRTYLLDLSAANPEDTALVETNMDLSTRLWVENREFDPALATYEQEMQTAPTPVDSAYAALDYATTALRAQEDSSQGRLDSYRPIVAMSSISDILRVVNHVVPTAPATLHAGYTILPNGNTLDPNFPNPFNAVTTIRYYLPQASRVRLNVFNVMGQSVTTLVNADQRGGYHQSEWNASGFASGMYIVHLEANGHTLTLKVLLLK